MFGIKFSGAFFGSSGYSEAARQYALAIHEAGIPLTLSPLEFSKATPDLGEDGAVLQSLCDRPIEYDTVLVSSTPDVWGAITRDERSKRLIGLTTWETTKLHPVWVGACNRFDSVWVPSTWNRDVFEDSGVQVPVEVVPYVSAVGPDHVDGPGLIIPGVADDVFVFYSVFHWQERKNPIDLIETYIAAFEGHRDVVLVLKTFAETTDESNERIDALIGAAKARCNVMRYPRIVPLVGTLSAQEMTSLHRRGDCFVLLQRAEGWGLPHFEAAAHGNPVVTTALGGPTEFLGPDTAYLVDYTLRPVTGMSWSPYYAASGRWANPDLDQAVRHLRTVFEQRAEAHKRGARARAEIAERFSRKIVGQQIVDLLARTAAS